MAACNVTAATGRLGRLIVACLQEVVSPEDLAVTVRDAKKARSLFGSGATVCVADYADEDAMASAFEGSEVLIYIPSLTVRSEPRIMEFDRAVRAAERAGVGRFLCVGFIADHRESPFLLSPFSGYACRRLASSRLAYTYVRCGMYADPLPPYLDELLATGALPYPAGEGRVSFIPRGDIARAVAAMATTAGHAMRTYTLTGRRAYAMSELADLLTRVAGSPIRYRPMTPEAFAARYDEPPGLGAVLASLYQAVGRGQMDEVTDDVLRLTGRPPEPLEAFVRRLRQAP